MVHPELNPTAWVPAPFGAVRSVMRWGGWCPAHQRQAADAGACPASARVLPSVPASFRYSSACEHRRGLVDVVEDIAGVTLNRRYRPDAPRGVNGRNSDNAMLRRALAWEPSIHLRDGMERTCRWIHDEYVKKYG